MIEAAAPIGNGPAPPTARNPVTPLRVLHVDTERSWGGGQRQLCLLAAGLRSRGHHSWAAVRPDTRLAAELQDGGTQIIPVRPALEWDPMAVRRLRAAIVRISPDVVHAHAAHALALAALACAGTRARLVATRRVALPLRRNPLTRWKYARPQRIIAVSERVRRVLLTGGVTEGRIGVVRSGVDITRPPSPAPDATLAALGVNRGQPLVVMVSALVPPHKDPATFVAAVAAARALGCECRALLIGAGPLAAAAMRASRRARVDDLVLLTGARRDAVELLAAADVVVLSSRDEGLGTTLLDAMLAGVPVVATAAGGVQEVIRDGVDGLLVPVGDGVALGAAIVRILSDAGLRAALVDSGRQRVGEFSIDHTVEGTLREYRVALRERRSQEPA